MLDSAFLTVLSPSSYLTIARSFSNSTSTFRTPGTVFSAARTRRGQASAQVMPWTRNRATVSLSSSCRPCSWAALVRVAVSVSLLLPATVLSAFVQPRPAATTTTNNQNHRAIIPIVADLPVGWPSFPGQVSVNQHQLCSRRLGSPRFW